MSETVLELVEVSKIFNEHSSNKLTIFQNMNLKIKNSELVGIIAPSGTGKTSLLNISGLLDLPTHGEVKIIAGINPINVLIKAVKISDTIISLSLRGAINKFVKFLLQISSKKSILKLMLDLNRIS